MADRACDRVVEVQDTIREVQVTWAYYNEFDAYCAQWLRNLIASGHIPAGEVDERDIREVSGDDLEGFGQCYFFAGLGGWAYACRLAGVADDLPLWTGSCPCQPLSSAGQRKGHADERHLWPAFHALIAERRPATVFGEQVASKDGREWFAGVRADLEHLGYAVGAADLPACCKGAEHERARLWWVAAHVNGEGEFIRPVYAKVAAVSEVIADVDDTRLSGGREAGANGTDAAAFQAGHRPGNRIARLVPRNNWSHQPCVGSGVHGIPGRVGAVSAYGNAIVPQVAAEFMMAAMESAP